MQHVQRSSKAAELNEEKTKDSEYTIKAKLEEKDYALATLSDQVEKLIAEVQELKRQHH